MIPNWLHIVAWISILVGFACAAYTIMDVRRHPQHMKIMNYVWPICALFGHVLIIAFYLKYGRLATHELANPAMEKNETPPHVKHTPFPFKVAKGTLHCGSGCTLGDIIAESIALFFPVTAVWFGLHTLFDEKMFAVWVFDYVLAFIFGIAFQYFTIVPMRGLSPGYQGRLSVVNVMADRNVWLHGLLPLLSLRCRAEPQTGSSFSGILVPDADRHGFRVPDVLPR